MSERLENMNANKINAVLVGIISKASSALVYDDEDNQAKALREIAEELSETLGTSMDDKSVHFTPQAAVPAMVSTADGTDAPCVQDKPSSDAPTGYDKFLTVADGVKLVRFARPGYVKLVALRKGHDGCPNCVFEINVDKDHGIAFVYRNGAILYRIVCSGMRISILEQIAVSSLHRYLKINSSANKRRRDSRKRRRMNKGIEK